MAFAKGEHPRLFFSHDELLRLREQARTGVRAEALARLTQFCDRLLDPRDAIYFDYRELQQDFWRRREGRWTVEPSLSSLSIAYAFTDDKRYGEAARDALMTIITKKLADSSHPMPGYGVTAGWRHGGGHDKAMYAWAISHVYDMCYDLFSEEQRRLFIAHVLENIEIARKPDVFALDSRTWMNNRGARATICCFGIYGLLLEGEIEGASDLIDQARYVAELYLYTAYDQDGVPYEGHSYGGVLGVAAEFGWMLRRSGRPNLLRNRRFGEYLRATVYQLLPGDRADVDPLNDCERLYAAVGCCLLTPKEMPGREILPWLLRQLDLHPKRIAMYRAAARPILPYPAVNHYILLNWDDAAVRTPEQLGYPLSRCFPQRGIADMRTGWGKDGYLLSHFCGYEMMGEHRQSDFNHVALYALNEEFLVDEGYGQVEVDQTPPQNHRYFSRADLHNTVIFDGKDQQGNHSRPGLLGWGEGRIIAWQHTPEFDSSLGDAAGAYGDDHTIERALRRVVFVRKAAHPFTITFDAVQVDPDEREHDFEALWRTAKGNRIEVDGRSFKIVGAANDCFGTVLSPADVQMCVLTHYNLPQLRVKQRAKALEMVTALVPVLRGELAPTFYCEKTGEREYRITVTDAGAKHVVCAGTRLEGATRTPAPVTYSCVAGR